MNAKCPKCGFDHANLNYDVTYTCHMCKTNFIVNTPTAPVQTESAGFAGILKLVGLAFTLYALYLCFFAL